MTYLQMIKDGSSNGFRIDSVAGDGTEFLEVTFTNVSVNTGTATLRVQTTNPTTGSTVNYGSTSSNTGAVQGDITTQSQDLTFRSAGTDTTAERRFFPYVYSTTNNQTISYDTITVTAYYNSGNSSKILLDSTQQICFRGDTQVKTSDGYKNIENLKRGDMLMTNAGHQPLAKLTKGGPISMIKIPKDLLAKNVPNRDVVVCPWHPLSVKIVTGDDDDEPEFLHMRAGELEIFDEVKRVSKGDAGYNLILDKHHEVDVGGMKFLSHHPNHNDGKHPRLAEGEEIDASKRAKKVYVSKDGRFVNYRSTTIKKLLDEMLRFK